jgi:hypothetical protein
MATFIITDPSGAQIDVSVTLNNDGTIGFNVNESNFNGVYAFI